MEARIIISREKRPHTIPSTLRVCHLGKYYPPAHGGIETHLQTLAQAQARLGVQVEVLCINHETGPTTHEKDGEIPLTRFCPLLTVNKLEISAKLVNALRNVHADVLHIQVPNPTMLLAVAVARPRIPIVISYQSDVVRQRILGALFRPIERMVYRRVSVILATSSAYANGSKFLQAYRDRIHIVPLGLDLNAYLHPSDDDIAKASELRSRYAGPVWLACGRLIYYKGLHNAIRALTQVPGTLMIIGEGPDRASLESEARKQGVAERVAFLGAVAGSLAPYYQAATAFWFPSNFKSEAFGLVQVEAMASGCPVINTNIVDSGVPWVSPHEVSGLTVPIDDPSSLAAAARRLIEEPGLRKRLAQGGRERAMREFDWRLMAERTLEVYQSILCNKQNVRFRTRID